MTFALTEKLLAAADTVAEQRSAGISDAAIRVWRDEVRFERSRIVQADPLIGYEATCLVEAMAALAFARSDKDTAGESRALTYINSLRVFMRMDLTRAQRAAEAAPS